MKLTLIILLLFSLALLCSTASLIQPSKNDKPLHRNGNIQRLQKSSKVLARHSRDVQPMNHRQKINKIKQINDNIISRRSIRKTN